MIENTEELQGQLIASGNIVASMVSQKGEKGDKGDTGSPGTPGVDGVSPVITTSKQGKVTTLTIVDAEGTKTATILDGADGSGGGDMYKSTYDTNDNGVVDNAEKVNNHTVESDVPANAVFTDTTYTAGTGIDITNGVITNTQTSAEWGNISGDIDDQTDLQNALADKVDSSDLAAVATSGDYNDLSNTPNLSSVATSGNYNDLTNKPTIPTVNNAILTLQKNGTTLDTFTANASVNKTVNISVPTKVSDITNDSGFINKDVNNLTNYTTTSVLNTLLDGKENDIVIQDTAPANPSTDDLWIDTSEPEEMQEAIVNEYSESTNETYSCDYLNKSNTYSTTEIKTGKIWIDGKPIYSRVVNVGVLPNNTSLNVPTSTFDGANKFITQMYGIGASSQEEYLKIPYYATDQNYINLIINSTHQISISTGADRSRFTGYIYLEYTKTTD